MNERERVVEIIRKAETDCANMKQCEAYEHCGKGDQCQEELIADYLLANGVIVPPCKVGDTVYIITDKNKIVKRIVRTFRFLDDLGYEFECTFREKDRKGLSCLKTNIIHSEELGKTVFLSRELAEKALAERSKG